MMGGGMVGDRLITQKQWNAKLRELRVAKELLRAAEAQIEILGEAIDNGCKVTAQTLEHRFSGSYTLEEQLRDHMTKNEAIPMVKRATGRTIPDLTGREHVCEWQSALMKTAERFSPKDAKSEPKP